MVIINHMSTVRFHFNIDIHLASPGVLFEGEQLNLTCTVIGHTPEIDGKVTINYWFSGHLIKNCSGAKATESPNDSGLEYKILTSTCELNAHSNQSNSGNYSCSALIEGMEVSSKSVNVNVKAKKNWKTTAIAAGVGSGVALIAAVIIAIGTTYGVHRKRRNHERIPVPEVGHPVREDENAHLLRDDNPNIRRNPGN